MSETHEEPVMTSTTPTLGERLRQAREAKKYTIAEVAAQLRLTKDIVSYLENQEWERLNGRTYARGYFASYVKFLGLPYDEMLAVFNLEYTVTEPAVNLRQQQHVSEESSFPWFMLALIAIVMLVAWLAYQQWQTTQLAQQNNAVVSPQVSAETEQDSFADSIVEPVESDVTTGTQPIEALSDSASGSQAPEADNESDSSDIVELEENTAETDNSTEQINQTETQLSSDASQKMTLRMSFSAECWVEVTSDDAKVLVSQVMQADDSLELSTEDTLNILLGRANAATVFLNDEQVDLKPYTQGDVARLTLGVES